MKWGKWGSKYKKREGKKSRCGREKRHTVQAVEAKLTLWKGQFRMVSCAAESLRGDRRKRGCGSKN